MTVVIAPHPSPAKNKRTMIRFLPIKTALGEAAALRGLQPTAAQFAEIEYVLRKQIVVDFQSGKAGIWYANGDIIEPADFVADALKYSGIAARPPSSATCSFAPEL